jgi:hypothetical protein
MCWCWCLYVAKDTIVRNISPRAFPESLTAVDIYLLSMTDASTCSNGLLTSRRARFIARPAIRRG